MMSGWMWARLPAFAVAALSNADCDMLVNVRREVLNSIKQKYPNGELSIDSNAFVIYGEK